MAKTKVNILSILSYFKHYFDDYGANVTLYQVVLFHNILCKLINREIKNYKKQRQSFKITPYHYILIPLIIQFYCSNTRHHIILYNKSILYIMSYAHFITHKQSFKNLFFFHTIISNG